MKIVKELGVSEVSGTIVENAPYEFTLHDLESLFTEGKESSMTVDANTATRHGIPLSLELVGRTLVCSFESHQLPVKEDGRLNGFAASLLGIDDVVIEVLEKRERISPLMTTYPPSRGPTVLHTLKLSTLEFGGSVHSTPCPFYHLFLELTEEEYEECKALSPYTVFRASFSLKAVEVSEPAEQGAS